jgi:hypothetical protein
MCGASFDSACRTRRRNIKQGELVPARGSQLEFAAVVLLGSGTANVLHADAHRAQSLQQSMHTTTRPDRCMQLCMQPPKMPHLAVGQDGAGRESHPAC